MNFLQTQPPSPGGAMWTQLIFLVVIFVVMYLFLILPQQRQQKREKKFRESLKKGDKVITTSGIYGEIVSVDENTVLLEIDKNVKIRIEKTAIRAFAT